MNLVKIKDFFDPERLRRLSVDELKLDMDIINRIADIVDAGIKFGREKIGEEFRKGEITLQSIVDLLENNIELTEEEKEFLAISTSKRQEMLDSIKGDQDEDETQGN